MTNHDCATAIVECSAKVHVKIHPPPSREAPPVRNDIFFGGPSPAHWLSRNSGNGLETHGPHAYQAKRHMGTVICGSRGPQASHAGVDLLLP